MAWFLEGPKRALFNEKRLEKGPGRLLSNIFLLPERFYLFWLFLKAIFYNNNSIY
jgi:hypothetical protein